jgi:hypothetical protein
VRAAGTKVGQWNSPGTLANSSVRVLVSLEWREPHRGTTRVRGPLGFTGGPNRMKNILGSEMEMINWNGIRDMERKAKISYNRKVGMSSLV